MLHTDRTLDWWWLYLQVVVLVVIIAREFVRPRGRNLFAILIPATMLVLVQGQTWWMLSKFEQSGASQMQHMYQTVSLDGARLANLYIGLSAVCFGLTYALLAPRKPRVAVRVPLSPQRRVPSALSYVLTVGWTLGFGLLLLQIAGGLYAAVTKPGQTLVGGLSMFLILTGLGKLPVLRKLTYGQRINWLDLTLFALTVFFFLINSRFLTVFILLQLAMLLNYCRHEVSRRLLLGLVGVTFLIIIVFGLYREYTARNTQVDLGLLPQFFMTRTGQDSPLEWFYSVNVEGVSGLAGILTYEAEHGSISHDWGLSNLAVLTRFVPSILRNDPNLPFRPVSDFLHSLYPYSGSVVAPGMENAYAHFGLPGVLGFGVLLGYLARWLHARMLNAHGDRLQVALLSVQSLQLIRGSFFITLFWGLADVVMLWVYRVLLASARELDASIVPAVNGRLESHDS